MSVRNPEATTPVRRAQSTAEGVERTSAFEGLARAGFVS
jgi:hypothetical protein